MHGQKIGTDNDARWKVRGVIILKEDMNVCTNVRAIHPTTNVNLMMALKEKSEAQKNH